MKYVALFCLTFGLTLFGCHSDTKSNDSVQYGSAVKSTDTIKIKSDTIKTSSNDKSEIRALIINTLKWADSAKTIDLLPVLSKDSICVGFDFEKLNQTLEKLRKTGFFADEFINTYNQIIRTLDKKIRNNEFEKWNVYELPTFNFANDVDPWCLCQDNLSWEKVEIEIIKLSNNKGELTWNWGKLDPGTDPSWKDFSYKFRVVKVDNKWKISYLQGFDYKESIR